MSALRRALARQLCALLSCFCLWAACGRERSALRVDIRLPEQTLFSLGEVRFAPEGHVRAIRHDASGPLQLHTDGAALRVQLPDLCPIDVPAAKPADERLELRARRLLQAPRQLSQIGYGASFRIAIQAGCAEAARGTIRWRQVQGRALPELVATERGYVLRGRTLPLSSYFPEGLSHGLNAVSPRTQGRYELEATPEGQALPVHPFRIVITSTARATGLPSVSVSQRLLLGGGPWRSVRAPRDSRAQIEPLQGAASFAPDLPGKYALVAGDGRTLELQALTHDLTPLDCGRAECHAAIARDTAQSPMSRALELPFEHGVDRKAQTCMLECHAVGEPGLHDGGYVALASALSFQPHEPAPWKELPTALQRLAGVRCTSCHGPGAVPPHEGRARILRSSVCATCHDAPPDYPHVVQWSASRMARADAAPESREVGCAECHTTGGFLHQNGVRLRDDRSRDADAASIGISCAACHAPHGAHVGKALVRALAAPALLPELSAQTTSAVCVPCHSPRPDELAPRASSAALWLGRMRLPAGLPESALEGPAPHAQMQGGCVGCHGRSSAQAARTDHSFRVDSGRCRDCHEDGASARWAEEKRKLALRARALWSALARACNVGVSEAAAWPPHTARALGSCATPALTLARYQTALVVEDAAAYEHNAPFAAALLDSAERALASFVTPRR